jgi:hypothetical protein
VTHSYVVIVFTSYPSICMLGIGNGISTRSTEWKIKRIHCCRSVLQFLFFSFSLPDFKFQLTKVLTTTSSPLDPLDGHLSFNARFIDRRPESKIQDVSHNSWQNLNGHHIHRLKAFAQSHNPPSSHSRSPPNRRDRSGHLPWHSNIPLSLPLCQHLSQGLHNEQPAACHQQIS